MSSTFDATNAVLFDLRNGSVSAPCGGDQRLLLVPAEAIDEVVRTGGAAAGVAVGLILGAACGRRAASRLGGSSAVTAAPLEAVITQLGGELSMAGLGALSIERWGRAMVLVLDRAAIVDDGVTAAVLQGALVAATGRPLGCTALGRDGSTVRVLVASSKGVERARVLLGQGLTWGDVLARLHARGSVA